MAPPPPSAPNIISPCITLQGEMLSFFQGDVGRPEGPPGPRLSRIHCSVELSCGANLGQWLRRGRRSRSLGSGAWSSAPRPRRNRRLCCSFSMAPGREARKTAVSSTKWRSTAHGAQMALRGFCSWHLNARAASRGQGWPTASWRSPDRCCGGARGQTRRWCPWQGSAWAPSGVGPPLPLTSLPRSSLFAAAGRLPCLERSLCERL